MTSDSSFYSFSYILERIQHNHDPTTDSWFLMHPTHIATVLVSYLIFALYLGPKLMRNRPPMDLKYVMIAYNVIQIITNLYFVHTALKYAVLPGYLNVFCEGDLRHLLQRETSKRDLVRNNSHLFLLSRTMDLCDTIFIVLKKKNNQLSFLHVYHHFLMTLFPWIIGYASMGERFILLGLINCTVHSVMYFYYSLMLLRPKYKKSIWWKKHITQMQLLQFGILLVQYTGTIFNPSCDEETRKGYTMIFPLLLSITLLFANFYYNAYVKAKPAIETNKNK